ncbi:hypothetical protein NEAUS03_0746 [Nematocida ausubeli]|nr:hypothetical protein NEAUS03_0746 [Nematocida ausubeli]
MHLSNNSLYDTQYNSVEETRFNNLMARVEAEEKQSINKRWSRWMELAVLETTWGEKSKKVKRELINDQEFRNEKQWQAYKGLLKEELGIKGVQLDGIERLIRYMIEMKVIETREKQDAEEKKAQKESELQERKMQEEKEEEKKNNEEPKERGNELFENSKKKEQERLSKETIGRILDEVDGQNKMDMECYTCGKKGHKTVACWYRRGSRGLSTGDRNIHYPAKNKEEINEIANETVDAEKDKKYTLCKDGLKREVPEWVERKELVERVHLEKMHATAEQIKKCIIMDMGKCWKGIWGDAVQAVSNCEKCSENNSGPKSVTEFVVTKRKLEKVILCVLDEAKENKSIIVMVDHYTRAMQARAVEKMNVRDIKRVVEEWIKRRGKPEEIISPCMTELVEEETQRYFARSGILHRKIGLKELYSKNLRMLRAARIIRELWAEMKESETLEDALKIIEEKYNSRFYSVANCSPNTAWLNSSEEFDEIDIKENTFTEHFKKSRLEEFKKGEKVGIFEDGGSEVQGKEYAVGWISEGIILEECRDGSYLVRENSGKISKKRHYNLKKYSAE